jgi:hypothetical protein
MTRASLIAIAVGACSHASAKMPDDAPPLDTTDAPPPVDAPRIDAVLVDAPHIPSGIASTQLCKLLSNRWAGDPTANDVQHRANILGADLGIPVAYNSNLYLLFGDTIGYSVIWPSSESHPDAVGVAGDTAAAVASQPQLLCNDLGILHLSSTIATDPSVHADFAGAFMSPPSGHSLGEYIHNPAGSGSASTFTNLPGDFEVPSGAFGYGDSIYVFYTTVVSHAAPQMTASYLARWQNPSPTGSPGYQILYGVDALTSGALNGHFINVSTEVSGNYVYMFGTGPFRASPIYLARKRLDQLTTPGGFEDLGTVAPTAAYGETSVRYFAQINTWMLLAEELTSSTNRIVAYTATSPTGPWTGPTTILDMADPQFRSQYCCTTDDNCVNQQMFNCDQYGFYGSYLLPSVTTNGNAFTVSYTLSSFAPYNVALFQTTFAP